MKPQYLSLVALVAVPLACSSSNSNSNNSDACASKADCPPSEFCTTAMMCSTMCDASSECPASLVCSNGACVQCAANSDCSGATPACDTTTNTCVQCATAADCSASTPVCVTATNMCVECTGDGECSGATPVCNIATNTCAACGADNDCTSGICTTAGACADPSAIVYIAAGGADAGNCGSAAPCRTISYAVTQTSSTRNLISMGSGAYNDTFVIDGANALDLHGHGAGITSTTQGSAFVFDTATTIRDVTFDGGSGAIATLVLGSGADYALESVTVIHGAAGIESAGSVTANGLFVHDAGYAVALSGGSLSVDRATIYSSAYGIAATAPAMLQLTNAMMYGFSTGLAVDLTNITGATISFSTIVGARAASPATVDCPVGGTISASIVWAPSSAMVPVTGCNLVDSSIVGPTAVAGATDVDPAFANATGSDYDLGSNSPAIDQLPSGPSVDYKGDQRPQGASYDIGADEYKP